MTAVRIKYFSDILCIWAYVSEIRLQELQQNFAGRVTLECGFFPVFGDTQSKFSTQWQDKGGLEGYSQHVQSVVKDFDHLTIADNVWLKDTPASSMPAHLYACAVQLLAKDQRVSDDAVARYARQLRLAFFGAARNIAKTDVLHSVLEECQLPVAEVRNLIENGEAYGQLSQHYKWAQDHHVKVSPTLIFNEDRQRLTGNVGYRMIEANIKELLDRPDVQHSWC